MLQRLVTLALLGGGHAEFNRQTQLRMLQDGHFVIETNRNQRWWRRSGPPSSTAAQHDVFAVAAVDPAGEVLSNVSRHMLKEPDHRTEIHARPPLIAAGAPSSALELDDFEEDQTDEESDRLLALAVAIAPAEKIPAQLVPQQPDSWSATAWKAYIKAQEFVRPLRGVRGGVVNVVATFAALGLGAESCILKLIYIMYTHEGEDDYPYLPTGCGMGFNYMLAGSPTARFSTSIKVILVVLAVLGAAA